MGLNIGEQLLRLDHTLSKRQIDTILEGGILQPKAERYMSTAP
jgi:hypothetical protein